MNRLMPAIAANWKLHQDNAPRHTCFVVYDDLVRNGIATLPKPLYSSYLALTDLFLFPRVKTTLKGQSQGTVAEIKAASKIACRTEKDFQDAFQAWTTCWQKCVDAQGSYFVEFKLFLAISSKHIFSRIWFYYFLYTPCIYWRIRFIAFRVYTFLFRNLKHR